MNVREIFDRVLTESGQYLFTLDNIEVKTHSFVQLVRSTLAAVNKHCPPDAVLNLPISGGRDYTFTENQLDCNGVQVGIPDYIYDVTPVSVSGVVPAILRDTFQINPELSDKATLPYIYRKPTLTVAISADFEVKSVHKHKLTSDAANSSDPTRWRVDTLTQEMDEFFALLTAKFIQTVGRSRRAFTLEDLPISSDADTMVGDGKEMEQEAIEQLQNNTAIHIGIGG